MNMNMLSKIHNRFDIEVKDIITGEIIQKAYAENIVLNRFFTDNMLMSRGSWSGYISFGRGTGTLSPDRTTLFERLGSKAALHVEKVVHPMLDEVHHKITKISLLSTEYVGETITEVGVGSTTSIIYTHALLKDSEGNPLALGPKTNTQEITIYATIYVTIVAPEGFTLEMVSGKNRITESLFGGSDTSTSSQERLVEGSNSSIRTYTGLNGTGTSVTLFTSTSPFATVPVKRRIETAISNGKIKSLVWTALYAGGFILNFPNSLFLGHEFDNILIGVGNGVSTTFNLPWNEARIDKPYTIYLDGVEQTNGITLTANSIIFETPPLDQVSIKGNYWVDYLPKDSDHVVDFQFSITVAEGVI